MMLEWKSPLAHGVGIPEALTGAAVAVALAFRVTGIALLGGFGGFSLAGCTIARGAPQT